VVLELLAHLDAIQHQRRDEAVTDEGEVLVAVAGVKRFGVESRADLEPLKAALAGAVLQVLEDGGSDALAGGRWGDVNGFDFAFFFVELAKAFDLAVALSHNEVVVLDGVIGVWREQACPDGDVLFGIAAAACFEDGGALDFVDGLTVLQSSAADDGGGSNGLAHVGPRESIQYETLEAIRAWR